MKTVPVYIEAGSRRVFAAALEWPGWCRLSGDEASALEQLIAYAPRYGRAIAAAGQGFDPPEDVQAFRVIERLRGDATTDFGAPGKIPPRDTGPFGDAEVKRLQGLLRACWAAFEDVARTYADAELRKGPRGGGRDLGKIRSHVVGAEVSYLTQLGGKLGPASDGPASDGVRDAFLDALARSARGEIPGEGPRGGKRWPAPYAARREAWHVLDHTWEIEDRAQ